jgi:hypothetical protein
MRTSKPPSLSYTAAQWTEILQKQLQLVANYNRSQDEDLPSSIVIDESIMDAPRRRAANSEAAALAVEIAQALYPSIETALGPIIQYEKDIVLLRHFVIKQRKRLILDATLRKDLANWDKRVLKQGPWNPVTDPLSLNGAPSLPMPVKIAE